jgi:hypothetical protein
MPLVWAQPFGSIRLKAASRAQPKNANGTSTAGNSHRRETNSGGKAEVAQGVFEQLLTLRDDSPVCVTPHRQAFLPYVTHCRTNTAFTAQIFWFVARSCKRNKWRENHVFRDLYRRLRHPNHRLGDRSQYAAPATEVDWCGNSLSHRRGDYAWRDNHSTKGSFVLRVRVAQERR